MGAEIRVSEKWLLSVSEALSSDVPIKEQNQSMLQESPSNLTQEDFDFGSVLFKNTEMCSADEVFFQGRILPLLSSNTNHNFSMSESVNSSENSGGEEDTPSGKSKMLYYFHCHHHQPSPKPQIKYPKTKNQTSKSTMWSHFRVGLSATPEIELEDLKVRSTRRNRSSSSSSDNGMSSGNLRGGMSDKKKKQGILDITGCKSFVNVEIVQQSKVVKGRRQRSNKQRREV